MSSVQLSLFLLCLKEVISTHFYSPTFGGLGGAANALTDLGSIRYIEWGEVSTWPSIVFSNINSNEVTWGSDSPTSTCTTINLSDDNEHIVKIYVWSTSYIHAVAFETNYNNYFECGNTGYPQQTFDATNNISESVWLSGIQVRSGGIVDQISVEFEYFPGIPVDLGVSLSYADTTCDPEAMTYGNGWIGSQYYEDSGNGHINCLYGPYGNSNNFVAREFTTALGNGDISVSIYARVWQVCNVEGSTPDYTDVEIYDKENDVTYSSLYYQTRSIPSSCSGWGEYLGSSSGFFSTCYSSGPYRCYRDMFGIGASFNSRNFVVKFVGVMDENITDEAWAISDFSIHIATSNPTQNPTVNPSVGTSGPTMIPSQNPSENPSVVPTNNPSENPSLYPSNNPSMNPSGEPTNFPSTNPTGQPTNNPTENPTQNPSINPTIEPSNNPTNLPSKNPSANPTREPSNHPSFSPTVIPSNNPTNNPTNLPTFNPIILADYPFSFKAQFSINFLLITFYNDFISGDYEYFNQFIKDSYGLGDNIYIQTTSIDGNEISQRRLQQYQTQIIIESIIFCTSKVACDTANKLTSSEDSTLESDVSLDLNAFYNQTGFDNIQFTVVSSDKFNTNNGNKNAWIIYVITSCIVLSVLALVVVFYFRYHKKQKEKQTNNFNKEMELNTTNNTTTNTTNNT